MFSASVDVVRSTLFSAPVQQILGVPGLVPGLEISEISPKLGRSERPLNISPFPQPRSLDDTPSAPHLQIRDAMPLLSKSLIFRCCITPVPSMSLLQFSGAIVTVTIKSESQRHCTDLELFQTRGRRRI